MRTMRIVERQNQRTELAALKNLVRTTRPLIEADKQLRRAYMAGYQKRIQDEAIEAKKALAEAAKKSLDPETVDAAVNVALDPDKVDVIEELNAVPVPSEQADRQEQVQKLFEEALKPSHDPQDQGTTESNQ